MIKNVVFDVGNVLVDYLPLDYIMSLGFDSEKANLLLMKTFGHDLWKEHDRGIYSHDELWDIFEQQGHEYALDIRIIRDGWWPDKMPLIDESADFLIECNNRGYNTYLLSNFNAELFEHVVKNKFSVLSQVKGAILSGAEKMVKPDPAIYKLLLERFKLLPDETVFIDDRPENIEAALALGIHGIVYKNPTQMKQDFAVITDRAKSS